MSMHLKELVSRMTVLNVAGSLNHEVTGLHYDARRVAPGSLYFSLVEGPDSYAEIQLALERGAVGVVCRRGPKLRKKQTCLEVPEVRMALAEAAAAFHDYPADKLRMIFVPGNCGHAQLSFVLKQVLEGAGIKTALIGSVRNELGGRTLPAGPGFAEPAEIQSWLAQAVQAGCGACIIETPLEAISRERFAQTSFDIAVLSNLPEDISPGIIRELGPVLRGSAQSRKALFTVFNWDQEGARAMANTRADVQVKFGFEGGTDVTAAAAAFDLEGTTFTLQLPSTRFPCRIPLRGQHNLSYILAAASVALCLDVEPATLQQSLEGLEQVPGNLEKIGEGSEAVSVMVDGARSREEVRQVLSSLKAITPGRVIVVFGCDYSTSGKARYEVGKVVGEFADYAVLTSDNPGREPVEQICSAIAQGIEQQTRTTYHFQPDRAVAIREGMDMARPGDVVLLAGKGERARQELPYTIIPFHDRSYAEEYLSRINIAPLERNRLLAEAVPQ